MRFNPVAVTKQCTKFGCTKSLDLHRHHRKSEKGLLLLARFSSTGPIRNKVYWKLLRRYEEFRESDIVLICSDHHAEIHILYDMTMQRLLGGRAYTQLTWKEIKGLMREFVKLCDLWMTIKTPGYSAERYFKAPRNGDEWIKIDRHGVQVMELLNTPMEKVS